MAITRLPKTGDAQDIGERARICLMANRPKNTALTWRLTSLEGADDFGLDFQVHTVVNQNVTDTFRIQLKGVESPVTDVENTRLAIQFDTSTLHLYSRISEPVLVVACDLSVAPDPVDCPLYYVWVHEELQRINLDGLPADQQTATVHVPKRNLLIQTTDFGPYLQHHLELVAAGRALDISVAQSKPDLSNLERTHLIQNVEKGLGARSPALLDAIAEPSDDYWVEPAHGSLAWHLRQAVEALRHGKTDRAGTQLEQAQPIVATAPAAEAGHYWLLLARTHAAHGRHIEAREAFTRAKELDPSAKNLTAWVESELNARLSEDRSVDMTDVEAALQGTDPAILSAKARLIAAQGRYADANALLATFSGVEHLAACAIIETMQGHPEQALAACLEGLAVPAMTKDSLRTLFLILRARARFTLATSDAAAAYPSDYVPPAGVPGLNLPLLRLAWSEILEAVEVMNDTGWTSNGEFVADMWAAASSMLGKQPETLPALTQAAKSRPHIATLQSAAEAMAAQLGEHELALEANARLPDSDIKFLRRVIFLNQLGRHRECIQLMGQKLATLNRQHEYFGPALALAATSAHKLTRPDLVTAWSQVLGSEQHLLPDRAVLEYMVAKAINSIDTSAALQRLGERYEELGRPMSIALALFEQLDPTDAAQAERCVTVAQHIQDTLVLPKGGAIHFGTALATLHRWDALLTFAQSYRDQFDPNARLTAFEALALDRLGRTAEARTMLENMINAGITDQMALNIYVAIMVRCGFTSEAKEAAERILESATTKRTQMSCVRLLFNLEQNTDPSSARLLALAVQMGHLVDREVEAEEGVYLVMVLAGTSFVGHTPTKEQVLEFQARAKAFFDKWPDSKIIKQVEINPDAPAEEMLASLSKLVGNDEERVRFRQKLENQLQRGEQPIPFAWRPQLALSNVRDVVHLWEIAKASHGDDRKYHLMMAGADWQPLGGGALRARVPLLDLIALLVVDDLQLLGRVFDLFPRIAVAQGTLEGLTELTHTFAGSPYRARCTQLQSSLKPYMDRIDQPSADIEAKDNRLNDDSAEIKALCTSGQYRLYTDDLMFRIYAGDGAAHPPMHTGDLLLALEEAGILSTFEVAQKYATLCRWRVGVSIPMRHQLAILPAGLQKVRTVREGVDLIQADEPSYTMASALWDVRNDFKRHLAHVARILRELVQQDDLPSASIGSYVGVWFLKAKLRADVDWPAPKLLTALAVLAAGPDPALSPDAMHKLLAVYDDLVFFHVGNQMDDAKSRQSRSELAAQAATTDDSRGSDQLRSRFASGMTLGTAESDLFEAAYSAARVAAAVKATKGDEG